MLQKWFVQKAIDSIFTLPDEFAVQFYHRSCFDLEDGFDHFHIRIGGVHAHNAVYGLAVFRWIKRVFK